MLKRLPSQARTGGRASLDRVKKVRRPGAPNLGPGVLLQDQLPPLALGGYGELLPGVPRPHSLQLLPSVPVQAHLVALVSPESMLSEGRSREPSIHSFIHSFVHPLAIRIIHFLLSVGQAGLEDERSFRAAPLQPGSCF